MSKQKKPVSKNYLLDKLPKSIMRQTLNITLEYLQLSGKIFVGKEGVEWVFEDDKNFKVSLRKAAEEFI